MAGATLAERRSIGRDFDAGVLGGELMSLLAVSSVAVMRASIASPDVFKMCNDIKVFGVYASRGTAEVIDLHLCRYSPLGELEREAMGVHASSIYPKLSIASIICGSRPKPARGSFSDVLPESLFRWCPSRLSLVHGSKYTTFAYSPPPIAGPGGGTV